jgi:TolA-binding protein
MDKKRTPAETAKPVPVDASDRAMRWFQQRRRPLTFGAVAVAVIAGGIWFARTAQERKESFAARALAQARTTADAGNLQLAKSDLGRVVSQYGGTVAGEEAVVLLARVRLLDGEANVAAIELRAFLSQGPRQQFLAPAAGLLGSALEDLGEYEEAADAFELAADESNYGLVRAEYLLDLGRAAELAGDTERASLAYEQVIDELGEESPLTAAARVRLAENRPSPTPQ